MTLSRSQWILTLLMVVLQATNGFALVNPVHRGEPLLKPTQDGEPSLKSQNRIGEQLIRVRAVKTSSPSSFHQDPNHVVQTVEMDPQTQEITLLSGRLQYRAENINQDLNKILTELGLARVQVQQDSQLSVNLGTLQVFHFLRVIDGTPLKHHYIHLRYRDGQLIQIVNALATSAEVMPVTNPSIESALKRIHMDSGVVPASTSLSYRLVESDKGYAFVPTLEAVVTTPDPEGTWVYSVHRNTGEILEIKPAFHFSEETLTGSRNVSGFVQASILPRTVGDTIVNRPMKYQRLSLGGTELFTDESGKFQTSQTGSVLDMTLSSKHFSVLNKGGSDAKVTKSIGTNPNSHDWTDSNSSLAERNAVYHLEEVRIWAKNYFASIGKTYPFLEKPLTTNVNINQSCNAFYNGNSVNFYQADSMCNNTAHIADVMYHEWGHGLDDQVAGGILDRAYSEGIGDIASMIQTKNNLVGPAFRTNGRPVRDLDPDKTYPQDADTEEHAEGLIIGSTYWDLWIELKSELGESRAHEVITKLFLESILISQKYTESYQALLAVDGYKGPQDTGPNYCIINNTFARHGLATSDPICVSQVIIDTSRFATSDGSIDAGDTAEFFTELKNRTTKIFKGVKASLQSLSSQISVHGSPIVTDFDANEMKALGPIAFRVGTQAQCNSRHRLQLAVEVDGTTNRLALPDIIIGKTKSLKMKDQKSGLGLPIPDNNPTGLTSTLSFVTTRTQIEGRINVSLDILHTYRGDLVVSLASPDGTSVTFINRQGRGEDDIKGVFSVDGFQGKSVQGNWTLKVSDRSTKDTGTLQGWGLDLPAYESNCLP